jgi:hypothetical protein
LFIENQTLGREKIQRAECKDCCPKIGCSEKICIDKAKEYIGEDECPVKDSITDSCKRKQSQDENS